MILAIDPGSEKTGIAVVHDDGSLAVKSIIPTMDLRTSVERLYEQYNFSHIVMGDGTNHKHLQPVVEEWIAQTHHQVGFSLINEKYTTVEGRKLYLKLTPRHGWHRLLPLALQYPSEPVDDFVAWIIGQRYVQEQGEQT
jgi:RNase H-fold protein (predicted Holliday junction resolvase)